MLLWQKALSHNCRSKMRSNGRRVPFSNLLRGSRRIRRKHTFDQPLEERGGTAVEATMLRSRVLRQEATHSAIEEEFTRELLTEDTNSALLNSSNTCAPRFTMVHRITDKYEADDDHVLELLTDNVRRGMEARERGLDEKETLMNDAKGKILMATSNHDFLLRADLLIRDDWLGRAEELWGNIYRIGAFKGLAATGSRRSKRRRCADVANIIGCGLIFFVQVVGPFFIFLSTLSGLGREYGTKYDWSQWKFINPTSNIDIWDDWKHIASTKLLGLCFLELFILNTLSVSQDEGDAIEKVWDIFQYIKDHTPEYKVTGSLYLFMDCFVNNWVVIFCTLDAYMIIGSSRTPSSLVLDSVALLFLFNLDDIGCDMGFVNEDDWPGHKLGWIYTEIVEANWAESSTWRINGPEENRTWQTMVIRGMNNFSFFFVCFCAVTLPILASITPFLQIVPPS